MHDSLLLLDTDLEDPDHDTSMEVVVPENNSDHENSLTRQLVHHVSDPNDSVTDDDHDIYSPPQPRRRRGDVGSTRGRAMRARGRGRGRGGGKGRGRMRGQGTRGTRRGGRMARSVHANPVDDNGNGCQLTPMIRPFCLLSMLKVDHLLKLQTQPWTA